MEQEKITWAPEEKLEITGREFETFARLVSLYELPYNQLSLKELQELFIPALQSSQEILKRMLDLGIAKKENLTSQPLPEN